MMAKRFLINDTFSKTTLEDKHHNVFDLKEDNILFLDLDRYKPSTRVKAINEYRVRFWSAINRDDRRYTASLNQMLHAWQESHSLSFIHSDPLTESHHDIIIEYLSWQIWKAGIIEGAVFTTQVAKKF